MSDDKICFVICPIGEEGTEIRVWSDLTFEYIIKPVVEQFGYKAVRANDIKQSGMITSQIIEQLIEAPLVIADLTSNNPNVFYELAVRHIVQKPYLQMIKTGQSTPFDVNGMRTIFFDIDLKQADNAKIELSNQIESIESDNFKAVNPITLAHTYRKIQNALEDDSSVKDDISHLVLESLNEVVYSISEMKGEISSLKAKNMTNPQINLKSKLSDDLWNISKEREHVSNKIAILLDELNSFKYADIDTDSIAYKEKNGQLFNLKIRLNQLLDHQDELVQLID